MPTASERSRLISIVQSRQNARVRELRAAFARSSRDPIEAIALEGEHLLAEALRSGIRLRTVFVRHDPQRHEAHLRLLDRLRIPPPVPIVELTPPVFDSVVETESPQGIAALADPPRFSLDDLFSRPAPLIVIAAGLQDPGNFGTLIRSAEAFAASGILALPGTVCVWNSKVLRASAGSAFRVPVVSEKPAPAFAALADRRISVYAAVPGSSAAEALPCSQVDWTRPAALIIGNEGSGLSQDLLDRADQLVSIPTPGPVESLNAAVAASVLLYEAARQRAHP
ncbi:MAG TPA: RNA methyltransferase [Acidobacteriaceae bacterium]|jgi:TrmH family RNA methyltransferase|nr:RNA methyltransferase [Acidobacteriaceae bacterium]